MSIEESEGAPGGARRSHEFELPAESEAIDSAYWANWYRQQQSNYKRWAMYRDRYLCPCCYMPTLNSRADYEICPICFWEDDGQDSHNADVIKHGPNQDYSLTEARDNFSRNHTMCRQSDVTAFKGEMELMPHKKALYKAFTYAIRSDNDEAWQKAMMELFKYYGKKD